MIDSREVMLRASRQPREHDTSSSAPSRTLISGDGFREDLCLVVSLHPPTAVIRDVSQQVLQVQ